MRVEQLNRSQVETLVQHELLVQVMEQLPLEMTHPESGEVLYTIKMYNLVNRVKLIKQNVRNLNRDSQEYVVAKSKFEELNSYVKTVRERTINNEDWRANTLAGITNVGEAVQLVIDYDVEAEYEKLNG